MRVQAEEARRANEDGKSEGYIVPVKPGNSGGGKVAKRWWKRRLSILWTQIQTLDDNSNPFQIVTPAWRDSHRGEPDALTSHVRF